MFKWQIVWRATQTSPTGFELYSSDPSYHVQNICLLLCRSVSDSYNNYRKINWKKNFFRRANFFFIFYVPCPFRTWVIIVLQTLLPLQLLVTLNVLPLLLLPVLLSIHIITSGKWHTVSPCLFCIRYSLVNIEFATPSFLIMWRNYSSLFYCNDICSFLFSFSLKFSDFLDVTFTVFSASFYRTSCLLLSPHL